MQPPKKYSVVMIGQDGAHTLYPMKEWCRQNPDEAPPIDPNTNSQQLRRAFIRMGWVTEETETQVLVLHPGTPKTAVQAIENDELDLMSKTHQILIERRFLSWNGSFVTSYPTTSKR